MPDPLSGSNRQLGWGNLTSGNMSVDVVPSTHATLLHRPQVSELARLLSAAIDSSETITSRDWARQLPHKS